ncbi:hypothetical protein ABFS82_09G066200 [Erythranthe guttata]
MGGAATEDSVQVYSSKKNGYFHHLYGSSFYGAVMRKRVSKISFNKKIINNNGIYSRKRGCKHRRIISTTIKKRDDVISFQTGEFKKTTREEEEEDMMMNVIKESSSGQYNVVPAVDQVNHLRFWTKPRCRVLLPTEKLRFTIDMDQDLSDSDLCFGDDEDQDSNW